ncbi:VanZ family protein [Massilia yuzhufengensis]|uniref:VanZ like family protein n=1 Tax=Massilia yuzhufengensis TaxID=1164594 RepID=A0A1I1THP4_9BURK|nr:VanZ family protein [Massilia yuzhufengensis]SFD58107.1 VanZ like family protein [Massilia yuzhufengensis]
MPAFLTLMLLDPRLRPVRLGLALVLYAGILVAGSIPGARAELGEYAPGVVLHGLTYAFLAMLWFLGSAGSGPLRAAKAVLAIALMGAGDELIQSFLPYRSGDVRDWMVDVSAAIVASSLLAMVVPQQDSARQR